MTLHLPIAALGRMDIYLVDQLLRGRVAPGARVYDAGCGGGRNLEYFLRAGHRVTASDVDPRALANVAELCRATGAEADLVEAPIENATVPAGAFDLVVCNAVLHFARDDEHFDAMVEAVGRALAPEGMLFVRVASSIGLEDAIEPLGRGRFALPDGTERYLVDEARLLHWTERLGAQLLDPIKTTNVQGLRCMTTWVLGH